MVLDKSILKRRPLLHNDIRLTGSCRQRIKHLPERKHALACRLPAERKSHQKLKPLNGEFLEMNADGNRNKITQNLVGTLQRAEGVSEVQTDSWVGMIDLAYSRCEIRRSICLVIFQSYLYVGMTIVR
jgi:hypothetical protein